MKISKHISHYGLLFIITIIFPVLGKSTISNDTYQKAISLSDAIDEVANVYQVNIVYDVAQIANKKVKDWGIQHTSVEAELKGLQKKASFDYKKLNTTTYIIKTPITSLADSKETISQAQKHKTEQPILKAKKAFMTVSGTVYDADEKEALIGVNVLIKGKSIGTATDFDGNFSLEAEEGAILILSYTGYLNKEVKVTGAQLGDIFLEANIEQLEEVVVIGYGTQKRSDLTGALSSVSEEEIKALPATGLDQALLGRAAGVQVTQNSGAPGGGVSIRIRGIGSTLSAEPLYVIDGIPVVNDNIGSSSNFSEFDGYLWG